MDVKTSVQASNGAFQLSAACVTSPSGFSSPNLMPPDVLVAKQTDGIKSLASDLLSILKHDSTHY